MSDLVERLRGIYRMPITDGLGSVGSGNEPDNPYEFVRTFPVPPIHREAAAEIERLTESNNALMVEREMLIKTKRDQIERLTAERDAARAKVAKYEQAPVVGWAVTDGATTDFARYKDEANEVASSIDAVIPLIARPEVTK